MLRRSRTQTRQTPYQSKVNTQKRVFVGNLPWSTKWQDLKDLCSKYGTVTRSDVMVGDDGRSRGYGIVVFASSPDAQTAITNLNGQVLEGRTLKVKLDDGRMGSQTRNGFQQNQGRRRMTTMPMGANMFSTQNRLNQLMLLQNQLQVQQRILNLQRQQQQQKVRSTSARQSHQGNQPNTNTNTNSGPGAKKSVYVGNLPWSTQWYELKDLCKKFGTVLRADLRLEDSGRSKGHGIVVFSNSGEAQKCVQGLNGYSFEGRELVAHLDKFFGQPFVAKTGETKVFVWNLSYSTKWQALKDLSKNFGYVNHVGIETDDNGKSKGYGVITFANLVSAQNCVNVLNGQILDGRSLSVRFDRMPLNQFGGGRTKKQAQESINIDVLDTELDNYMAKR